MIAIVWRGSGILVLIYVFLSAWICSYWFDDTRLGNAQYMGWVLFWAAIVTTIHALLSLFSYYGHDENDTEPRKPLLNSHLFYIPVLFWPLILGGISAKCLINTDPDPVDYATTIPPSTPEEKVIARTIHFLNPTEDTMYYEISGVGGAYKYESVSPHTYVSKTIDPGKYCINGIDANGKVVFTFPSGQITNNKSMCVKAKNHDGANVYHRIIGEGTESEKDCDDIWIVLTGERDMMMIDITSLCTDSVSKTEVENTDWTKLVQSFDGTDIIEPLYGKDPGKSTYTVLATGDDFPTKTGKSEKVFALFSYEQGTELNNEYLVKRILKRLPDDIPQN